MVCCLGRNRVSLCVLCWSRRRALIAAHAGYIAWPFSLYDGFVRLAWCSQLQVLLVRLHCTTCIIGHGSSNVPTAPQFNVFAVTRTLDVARQLHFSTTKEHCSQFCVAGVQVLCRTNSVHLILIWNRPHRDLRIRVTEPLARLYRTLIRYG